MAGNNLLLKSPVNATGRYSTGTVAAVEDVWRDVINRGVADLTKQMQEQIKPAAVLQGGHPASHQAADLGS
jgi:glycerate-2-kinase